MSLLINRTHKWVYIHIPKTGGSSISHILNTVEGTESISTHGSILEVKDNISDKSKKVVTFCTGGVRCEKATAYMKKQGFEEFLEWFDNCIDLWNLDRPDHDLISAL